MKKWTLGILLLCVMIVGAGCTKEKNQKVETETEKKIEVSNSPAPVPEPVPEPEPEPEPEPMGKTWKIAIDAGHQGKGNNEKEPIGPGATNTKAKVASGTTGVVTGIPEYELALSVSLKLEQILKAKGYEVVMIRTSNEVNISNAERAAIANEAGADAFIRVHANGSEDSSMQGALTMCMTNANPYNGQLYADSRQLSEMVLEGLCNASGAQKDSIIETDTMSGINWCSIPVTIVEMGFMSNPKEDQALNDAAYQDQIALGIADGIEQYFAGR